MYRVEDWRPKTSYRETITIQRIKKLYSSKNEKKTLRARTWERKNKEKRGLDTHRL